MKKPDYFITGTTLSNGQQVKFDEPVTNFWRAAALRAKAEREFADTMPNRSS